MGIGKRGIGFHPAEELPHQAINGGMIDNFTTVTSQVVSMD